LESFGRLRGEVGRPRHNGPRRPGQERLAVPEAVQVKSFQALPVAFKDHQRAIAMKSINVGYRLPILVGNAKCVQFLIAQFGSKLQMKVQIPGTVANRAFFRR
jgi:hypothetical protein